MQIYFAGPDVFRPDVVAWAEEVRALCRAAGHQALIPLDNEASNAADICAANLDMIRRADMVVANVDPFRGLEPDSGTAFELGFASALGLPVIAYFADARSLVEKVAAAQHRPLLRTASGLRDADGFAVEDFGLPLNLMLAVSARLVVGDVRAALATLEGFAVLDESNSRQV